MNLKNRKKTLEKKYKEAKIMPELIDTFRFVSVYCETCGQIAQTKETAFQVCANIEQLHAEALKQHSAIQANTKIICTSPQFIVSYESVLISNGLLNPQEKQKSSLIM